MAKCSGGGFIFAALIFFFCAPFTSLLVELSVNLFRCANVVIFCIFSESSNELELGHICDATRARRPETVNIFIFMARA